MTAAYDTTMAEHVFELYGFDKYARYNPNLPTIKSDIPLMELDCPWCTTTSEWVRLEHEAKTLSYKLIDLAKDILAASEVGVSFEQDEEHLLITINERW